MKTSYCVLCHENGLRAFPLFFLAVLCVITLQGCGTFCNGRGWGNDATLTPGWDRVKSSVVNAALSPETWAPAAGALILQVDDMDERISDWASENNPVFGSKEDAREWSNRLEGGSGVVYLVTALAAPGGDDPGDWLVAKAKGLSVGLTAVGITAGNTMLLKKAFGRTRPDGSDNKSMPSGHVSRTSAFTTLARRNLDSVSLSPKGRVLTNIGIAGIAVGTGWGRIEANVHYPSDVLAGYALGHFFSVFINDAFLGLDNDEAPRFTVTPTRKGVWLGATWSLR